MRPTQPVDYVGERLTVNFQLTAPRVERVRFGVFAEILQIYEPVVIARIPRDVVYPFFFEFLDRDTPLLRRSLNLKLVNIF